MSRRKSNRRATTGESAKRIRRLKAEIEKVAGPVVWGLAEDEPSDIQEAFLKAVLAFEKSDGPAPFDRLRDAGVLLPAPDELSDDELEVKLWEVIRALALLGVYLESTNHVSDRDLYTFVWNVVLRDRTLLLPEASNFVTQFDLLGRGSDDDVMNFLRYYADEETRRRWSLDFPDFPIPDRQPPPFDRDRFLPQREWAPDVGKA